MPLDPRRVWRALMNRVGDRVWGAMPHFPGEKRLPDLAYAPGVEIYQVPGMGEEGFSWKNRVYVGPQADIGIVLHEVEHTEQAKKYGIGYPLADVALSRSGVSYERNPFERAAVRRERQARGATKVSRR